MSVFCVPAISSTRSSSENTNLEEPVPTCSLAPATAFSTFSATRSRASSHTSSSSNDDAAANALSSDDEEPRKDVLNRTFDALFAYGYRRVRTPELARPQPRPRRPSQALPEPVQMFTRPGTPTPGFSPYTPSGQLHLPSLAALGLLRHAAQADRSLHRQSRGRPVQGMLLNSPPLTDMLVNPSCHNTPKPATNLFSRPACLPKPVSDASRPICATLPTPQSPTSKAKSETSEGHLPPPAPRPSYRQLLEPEPPVHVPSSAGPDQINTASPDTKSPTASTTSDPLASTPSGIEFAQSSPERAAQQIEQREHRSPSPPPELEAQRQASERHRENEQHVQQILQDLRVLAARKEMRSHSAAGASHSERTVVESDGSETSEIESSTSAATCIALIPTVAAAPHIKESAVPNDTLAVKPVYHPTKSLPLHLWLESISKGQEPPELGAPSETTVGDPVWEACDCCIRVRGLWGLRAQRVNRFREPTDEPPECKQPEYRAAVEEVRQQAERRSKELEQEGEAAENTKKRKSNATTGADAEGTEKECAKKQKT